METYSLLVAQVTKLQEKHQVGILMMGEGSNLGRKRMMLL